MSELLRPILRFKQEDGSDFPDWENNKLKNLFEQFIVPMRDKPKDLSGPIPWCRIEDFNGRYLNGSISGQGVSELTVMEMNLKVYPINTLLVSCSANLGICSIVKTKLITNQTFIGLVSNQNNDVEFLYYVMTLNAIRLNNKASGTTIKYLSRKEFENFNLPVPSINEQNKIASFLSSVDKKIELLTKKHELLEKFKKGLMQKIFSQEIRFKQDDGSYFPDWEKTAMGEIINKLTDYTANGSFASLRENVTYYSQTNYAVLVRTTDLRKAKFQPERFTDERGYDFLKKTSLFGGEIILSNVGSIGEVFRVPLIDKPMTLAPNTYLINFNDDNNEEFIYQILKSQNFKNKLLSTVASSGFRAINKSNLRSVKIKKPFKKEQQKIASFLSSIDKKIDLAKQQIEKTQTFKKGLLQQMFV